MKSGGTPQSKRSEIECYLNQIHSIDFNLSFLNHKYRAALPLTRFQWSGSNHLQLCCPLDGCGKSPICIFKEAFELAPRILPIRSLDSDFPRSVASRSLAPPRSIRIPPVALHTFWNAKVYNNCICVSFKQLWRRHLLRVQSFGVNPYGNRF